MRASIETHSARARVDLPSSKSRVDLLARMQERVQGAFAGLAECACDPVERVCTFARKSARMRGRAQRETVGVVCSVVSRIADAPHCWRAVVESVHAMGAVVASAIPLVGALLAATAHGSHCG